MASASHFVARVYAFHPCVSVSEGSGFISIGIGHCQSSVMAHHVDQRGRCSVRMAQVGRMKVRNDAMGSRTVLLMETNWDYSRF